MQKSILVTGATGNVGREVVKALLAKDQPVIATVLDADHVHDLPQEDAALVIFDFTKPKTFAPALEGVHKLFLVRPPHISDVQSTLNVLVDEAKGAGTEHIVFLSLMGAQRNRLVPHYKVEQHILSSGIPHTFLRPSFYMQNLNTTHRREILERDEIFLPVGKAKTSFIDVRDIGAVAARVLTEPGHENKAYDLTGGEALDYFQVADLFTEILGRRITYRKPSLWRFVRARRAAGLPLKFVLVMAFLYTSTRLGMAARVSPDVEQLLGRLPITMRQYVSDYAASWLPNDGHVAQ